MTAPLQLETAIPNIFDIIANGFKDIKKDMLNSILMSLIFSMKKEHEELKELYEDIKENNDMLLDKDLEGFYDALELSKQNTEKLYKMANDHKNKSEMFMELYKTTEKLYEDLVTIPYNIGTIESNLIHQGKLEYAS